jgi:hypothetical protein
MKLPTQQELQSLRKGLRKRKLPRVFDGMWCSEPGIGGMKVTAFRSDFHIEWVSFDEGVKSAIKHADWISLCLESSQEMQRLEIGMVVSEISLAQGQQVMDSIGHPIAAFNEAKPYRDVAESWKHWGLVKAGHMLGLSELKTS